MDASDTINKKKTQTIYIDQYNKFVAQNPGGDCAKLGTCAYTTSSCIKHYNSYQQKYDFLVGKKNCTGCLCDK